MQTYYDYTLKRWVTREANGAIRAATPDEAGVAATQAQGQGSGPGGNYGSGDSMRWATGGVGTGTGSGPGGVYDSNDSRRWAGGAQQNPPPAAPAPPPDPYQGWNSSDPGSRSYRYFDPIWKEYYEADANKADAWRQYTDASFGQRDTPQKAYADSQYGRAYALYQQAAEQDTNMHWTDYLSNDYAGQIRNSFAMQSPGQKGYNLMYMPAGRNV